ncbi:hypothetical protein [Trichormus variabilis]|nr:hypothetical protein [Trichormus variabilis]MBD2627430.1 hypothetical protein [Trichormus variabilis FACHB-164]
MTIMQELFDRLIHCLEPIQVIHGTCQVLNNDFLKRTIGRMVFIRLDDFIETAPRLQNQLKRNGHIIRDLKSAIRKLDNDYKGYYAKIRLHLTAHRDDFDIASRLDLWHDIDLASIEILADDAELILNIIHSLDSSLGIYVKPKEIDDNNVKDALLNFQSENAGITIGMDNLAGSRENTIFTIPCHSSQERGQNIMSCFDLASRQIKLFSQIETLACPVLKRTLAASITLDTLNLIEDIFGLPGRIPRHKTFVEIAKESGFQGADLLEQYANALPHDSCDQLIQIRNHVCAHYHKDTPIADLIQILDDITEDWQKLDNNLNTLMGAFYQACSMDIRTRMYLIHGENVKGILETDITGWEKPFT